MKDFLTLPAVFQNNMILQRQKTIRVLGTGPSRSVIRAVLNGVAASCVAGDDGGWELRFPHMEALSGGSLAIFCNEKQVFSFENVAIGEVWIAGGQSNMEFALCYERRRREVFRRPEDPLLRYFEVPKRSWEGQREGDPFTGSDFSGQGIWRHFSRENAPLFSAAAYYFAARLREKLGANVPVGIISCSWSGSPAFAWISEDALRSDLELASFWTEYYDKIKTQDGEAYERAYAGAQAEGRSPLMRAAYDLYMRGRIPVWMGDALKKMNPGFFDLQLPGPRDPWRPCGLYSTMVSAIAAYTCRGVIWYQGEGDDVRPEYYARLFALVIRSWRQSWNDELPFIFAQLAAFERDHFQRGDSFPELRRQQELAADAVHHTWMICTIDAGERFNVHPGDKGPVGERLAAAALAQVYGFDVPWRSPRVRDVTCADDGSIRIRFDGCYGGLLIRGSRRCLKLFSRNVETRRFEARTEGNTLVITPRGRAACTEGPLRGNIPDAPPALQQRCGVCAKQAAGLRCKLRAQRKRWAGGADIDAIQYAWEAYPKASLFNAEGFPALPFCLTRETDSLWRWLNASR